MSSLDREGFEDIRVVIGDAYFDRSPIRIDAHFTPKVEVIACGLFGKDPGVEKDENGIFSSYDKEADREKVVKSREEIRRIIKERNL